MVRCTERLFAKLAELQLHLSPNWATHILTIWRNKSTRFSKLLRSMSKTKKAEIQEIEQNMLVSWFEGNFGYLKPYYKTIGIVAALLLLAGLLLAMIFKFRQEEQSQLWNTTSIAATNSILEKKSSYLVDAADEMGDKPASLWARQLYANIELRQGLQQLSNDRDQGLKRIEKAADQLQKIIESSSNKSELLEVQSVYGMAYASESLGRFDDAKKYYGMIVDSGEENRFYEQAKLGLERSNNPLMASLYEKFKAREMGVAPGLKLPKAPDISFPEVDFTDDGGSFQPTNEDNDPAPVDDGNGDGEEKADDTEGGDDR